VRSRPESPIHEVQEHLSRGGGIFGCQRLVATLPQKVRINQRFIGRQLVHDLLKRVTFLIKKHMAGDVRPCDVETVDGIDGMPAQKADGLELVGR
jgi:hypothetical protein